MPGNRDRWTDATAPSKKLLSTGILAVEYNALKDYRFNFSIEETKGHTGYELEGVAENPLAGSKTMAMCVIQILSIQSLPQCSDKRMSKAS